MFSISYYLLKVKCKIKVSREECSPIRERRDVGREQINSYYLKRMWLKGKIKYSPNPKEKKIEKTTNLNPPFERKRRLTRRQVGLQRGRYASLTHT
jgi:hypothetical protein